MVVNTNILAVNSHRNMKNTTALQARSSSRLSSGLKINSAADDAAGLAISEKMRGQIRGLDMASKNTQDGISMVQTAEGGMTEISNMVQRIRELTVQAANDTNEKDADREMIQGEVIQLLDEIDSMAGRVEFNKKNLLGGSFAVGKATIYLQVGANKDQKIGFHIGCLTTGANGLKITSLKAMYKGKTGGSISGKLSGLDDALKAVSQERASLGAVQNRLEYTMRSLDISSENLTASESRIRDTDMAKEMMNLTKANVLSQAAQAMLGQANQAPQGVLQLLR